MFIVLEGTDGSGKTTQQKILVERLINLGLKIKEVSFPRYGEPSSTLVESYLRGDFGSPSEVGPYRASIFYAADRYAASFSIRSALSNGEIVIANRYVASNMAHQGSKITDPDERRRYFAWNDELEYEIFKIPKPDLNIILHVPAKIAQDLAIERARIAGKNLDNHEADLGHLLAAEACYLELHDSYSDYKLIRCAPDQELLSVDRVSELVFAEVSEFLKI